MNGFMLPRFPARKLIALALAGWMAQSQLHAQDDAPPAAPPAFPSDEPVATDQPVTQLIPTTPDEKGDWKAELIPSARQHNHKLVSKSRIPTPQRPISRGKTPIAKPVQQTASEGEVFSLWSEPEAPASRSLDEKIAPIQQVQASELVAPDNLGTPVEQDAALPPLEEPQLEGPATEAAPLDSSAAEMPAEAGIPLEEQPVTGSSLEPVDQPVQLQERPSPRTPAQYEINRTAASDSPTHDAGYQGRAAKGFSKDDKLHVVREGENYWSISKMLYGSGRYHGALAEYNKSRIADPNKLTPGMKIVVPPTETLVARYGKLIFGPAYDQMIAPPAPAGFFVDSQGLPMYRVGKGDSLSSIAETHLGRSSRWTEILKLNQQVLKHHDSLKLGTVLRLPEDASESATR